MLNDGFNMVRTVRAHPASPEMHRKMAPLTRKIALFFIVAPGCQWHVKNEIKFFF